jgi:hypothetical protein
LHRISGAYRDDVFVNVVLVDVVQVTVMKVVNMAVMADRCMPAIRAMLVGMVGMLLFSASGHDFVLVRLQSNQGVNVIAFRLSVPLRFESIAEHDYLKGHRRCASPRAVVSQVSRRVVA